MDRNGGLEAGIPTRLTRTEGRRFGLSVGGAFVALAALLLWRGRDAWSLGASVLGAPLLISGLILPDRLGPVYRAWMKLAFAISKATTPVFMALLFFLVITPTGLVARLLGRNPLVRRGSGNAWVLRPPGSRRSDLERQF